MRGPMSLAVVGADYPNRRGPGRRFEINLCIVGEPVELRPEPNNPADPNAVAVFSQRGIQIGYVTAERAPWIGKMLREHDVVALFQEAVSWGAVIRIGFDGAPPALPSAADSTNDDGAGVADSDPVFYPDEEWPDD